METREGRGRVKGGFEVVVEVGTEVEERIEGGTEVCVWRHIVDLLR